MSSQTTATDIGQPSQERTDGHYGKHEQSRIN